MRWPQICHPPCQKPVFLVYHGLGDISNDVKSTAAAGGAHGLETLPCVQLRFDKSTPKTEPKALMKASQHRISRDFKEVSRCCQDGVLWCSTFNLAEEMIIISTLLRWNGRLLKLLRCLFSSIAPSDKKCWTLTSTGSTGQACLKIQKGNLAVSHVCSCNPSWCTSIGKPIYWSFSWIISKRSSNYRHDIYISII